MLNAFETGQATLDQYIQRTVFYRPRDYKPEDFKAFMFSAVAAISGGTRFCGTIAASRKYIMAALNNESREINEYRIKQFKLKNYSKYFQFLLSRRSQTGYSDLPACDGNHATAAFGMRDDR